jgi:hypothetical protein
MRTNPYPRQARSTSPSSRLRKDGARHSPPNQRVGAHGFGAIDGVAGDDLMVGLSDVNEQFLPGAFMVS